MSDINLVHHSDCGLQCTCNEYVSLLKRNKIRISMTENGVPKDNPQTERINNTIKNEIFKGVIFKNIREVIDAMLDALNFYNNERPHMSINMITPAEANACTGEIEKRRTIYYLIAIKSKQQDPDILENGLSL